MRRFLRIALVVIGGAAVVAAAGFVALQLLSRTDLIRGAVERELRQLTRADVSVSSSRVSFAFPGVLALIIEDLAVKSAGDEPLFFAHRVILSPSITRLLRGEFAVTSLRIDGFGCTVTRTEAGEILAPVPVLSGAPTGNSTHPELGASPKIDESRGEVSPVPVTWSIESVILDRGRIDWVDRHTAAGREMTVPLREITAKLARTSTTNRFAMRGSGLLGSEDTTRNLVTLEGSLFLDPKSLEPVEASAAFSAAALDLHAFEQYLPAAVHGLKQVTAQVRAEWTWAKGRAPNLSLKAALRRHAAEASSVELDGEMVGSAAFDHIDQASCSVRMGSLPLNLFADLLPPWLPLESTRGTVGAELIWTWKGPEMWRLAGEVTLSDIAPATPLNAVAPTVCIDARVQLEPNRLLIDGIEVSADSPLVLVRGKIEAPLSDRPAVDLVAEATGDGRWFEALGIASADLLSVSGTFPLRGRLHGTLDKMDFDCTGGLTWATLSVGRILEKPRGKKAAITMRGRWSRRGPEGGADSRLTATITADLSGVRLPTVEELPDIGGLSLHVDSAVTATGLKIALDRVAITAKSESDQSPILSASATSREAGPQGQLVEGEATLSAGGPIAAGLERSAGLRITGASTTKVRVAIREARSEWSVELPLGTLGIELARAVRKEAGVNGLVRASGTWSDKGLYLNRGELTLPGVSMAAKGMLRDRKSAFGDLTLEMKEVDLRQLGLYAPAAQAAHLGGSIQGSLKAKPTEKGLTLAGTVKLSGVSFRPRGALWTLEGMDGALDIAGDAVTIPHVTGTVTGFAKGRFQVKGELKEATSFDTLDGRLSLSMSKGKIKADRLVKILNDAHSLLGRLLQPRPIAMEEDYIDFTVLNADLRIKNGRATTDDFKMRGADITTGFVGDLRLSTLHLDGMLGVHTMVAGSDTLGRIPGVRQLMDDHRDLLIKVPITAFAGLRGSLASSLDVIPVPENQVNKEVAARLHELMK